MTEERWILVYAGVVGEWIHGQVEMLRSEAEREAQRIRDERFRVLGIKNLETNEFVSRECI